MMSRCAALVAVVAIAFCSGCWSSDSHNAAKPATHKKAVVHHTARKIQPTYPPFVSEAQAKEDETAAVREDLPKINRALGSTVFTSFSATTEDGLPQFNFVVNQDAWDALSDEQRNALVKQGGAVFDETNRIYRKYHRGRVCLGDPDSYLMLHVVNENGTLVGLDYSVYVAHTDSGC